MQTIDDILSLVTDEPVVLPEQADLRYFPGCLMKEITAVHLSNGFTFGDFMAANDVSVAEEVSHIDVSLASQAPNKATHVVWRVALKSGPVAFMQLRVTGIEDSDTADVVITGEGLVMDDPALARFAQALMIETSRRLAFEEIEALVSDTARMTQHLQQMFSSTEQLANQASERLAKASIV